MITKLKLIEEINVGNILGESIVWDDRDNSLWWTDIIAKKLFHYDWNNKKLNTFNTPERLCSFGLTSTVGELIAAFETGICIYEPYLEKSNINWMFRPFTINCGIRFNDGRIDRNGRFWVSTMIESDSCDAKLESGLYSITSSGVVNKHFSNFSIGNSLAWSVNSQAMYFSDSMAQTIWKFKFDAISGAVSSREVFVKTPENAFPDGADIANDNHLYCTNWGDSSISNYNELGEEHERYLLPVTQPTCLAFGGKTKELLFVTSASYELSPEQLSEQPSAGNVFVFQSKTPGLAANIFGESQNV